MVDKKIDLETIMQVNIFVDLLKSSKAAWLNDELRTIALVSKNPANARSIVLKKGGTRRRAKATQFLAIAVRDYDEFIVRGALEFLKLNKNDFESLRRNLKEKLASKDGVAFLKGEEDDNKHVGVGRCREGTG